MGAFNFKQLGKQGAAVLAMVTLLGGLKAVSQFARVADAVESPQSSIVKAASPSPEFLVCSEAADWQRPSQEQQQKQLSTDERYGSLLQDKNFQQLANQFWQHDVLSFTTYGLSARMEPVNLSGLWSVAEDVWSRCYSQNQGQEINAGNVAEAWLMHHQVVDLHWQEDHYLMVVEPSSQGMQVVQFARQEGDAELPLRVVTPQGNRVAHYRADW